MESDAPAISGPRTVLKTVNRMPRTFINQLYAIDVSVMAWVSLGSISYALCALYFMRQSDDESCTASLGEQVASVAWTFQVQTAAFGAVLLLNLMNLGMRQHLLPFKCNLLLLYINGVAFVTDLLLWRGATTVLLSSSGRPFAPLRYVQWCHSTPTMIYMLALLADCSGWQLSMPLLSDVVMVVTGLLACYTAGPLKFVATVLSFVTFGVVLYYVYGMFHKTLTGDVSPEQRSTLLTVLALLLALWSAFPVVWLAADWQLMGPEAEAVAWGVCDYLAKVVFSSQLWQSNLTEVQLRRDRALEAWEASNRVEAVARLTALLKQRDDLLSTLSHELRTPLAGIVALSESLCQEVSAALPRSAQNLATVRATATCMLNIVTSTLDSFAARRGCEPGAAPGVGGLSLTYQPPDADAGPVAPSVPLNPLELRPLVETVMNVLRPLAHDGVAIVSDLPANLPQVAADVTRLSQVLYNLVGNAMRFTAHGEVRIAARVVLPEASDAVSAPPPAAAVASAPSTLRCADGAGGDFANGHATAAATSLSSSGGGGGGIWRYARPRLSMSSVSSCSSAIITYPPGTQVEVSVEDTGVGIAQELLDELFLPYRTGHAAAAQGGGGGDVSSGESSQLGGAGGRASKSIGGTGLGLYLVRLALRAQGSDITAESAPGIGSVFRFRLPATQPPPRQSHDHQSSRQATRQRRGGSLDERRRADNELLGAQAPLSGGSACECESGDVHSSSTTSGAAAGSEGTGADRDRALAAAPSSPKPVAALSSPKPAMPASPPRPWIASATARLVKLSGGRVGGSSGGAAVGGPAAAAACGPVPPRPLTGALPLQEPSSPLNSGRPLRMSLDEATHNKQMRQPPLPPAAGSRCRPSCAAGCCAPELSPLAPSAAAVGAAETTTGSGPAAEAAVTAPSASMDAVATASGGNGGAAGAAPLALVSTTPARVVAPALTPTPTPTAAAAAGVAVPAAMSMTAFDAAHAIEEGRALSRTGLRPNFRHRNGGTLQILSVDDDPINQLVAGQMLTSQAWKVVKCMNGPEALVHLQLIPRPNGGTAAAAAASPTAAASLAAAAAAAQALLLPAVLPDCVLLDVMMPGMSGFEVCRKLRQHFTSAQLPIIIVSAKGDTAAVDEAFESGADDYMTKPYKRTEMVARIKAQIRTRDSLMEAAAAQAAAPPPPAGAASESGVAAAAAPAPLPPPTTPSCGATTASSTPHACSSAVAARALLGCGGAGSDLAPPSPSRPTTLPPQHPLSQDNLPTSVDLLLVQQTTPDFIKTRMEASRGGLDGSWGKVGLYKRDNNMLSRTGAVTEAAAAATSPWDAAARAGAAKEQAMVPAAVLASPCALAQPGGDAPAGTVAPETAAPHSADSGVMPQRPDGPTAAAVARPAMADVAAGMSKPLPTLPEDTVIGPKAELGGTAAASDGTGAPTPLLSGGSAAAAAAATTVETAMAASSTDAGRVTDASTVPAAADGGNAAGGDGGAGGEPSAATALIREVLTEVRRSRVVEADVEKLTSRVAALRTACCALAAERDGWRRQARDLRALMATRIGGGAAVEAAAAIGAPGTPASTMLSAKGAPLHMTLAEALAAAHGSRSSGDSLGAAVGAAGAGAAQSGAVAAQLEDLKKEATFLRQQLSLALASVGNGSVAAALGPTDSGGSRMFGLASGGGPPTVRQQRSLLTLPRMSDSPHSAAMPVQVVGTVEGVERSGGGAGGAGDGAPTWGLSVFPNASFPNAPDMFLTTETSGLSAGSGDGGLGAGKSPHSGPSPGVGVDGSATAGKSKKLHGKTTSSSQGTTTGLAAAASVAGQGPPAAALTDRGSVAKQANGIGGGADSPPLAPLPLPMAAFGSAVTPIVSGIAEVTVAATPPPPPVTKADPQPQVFGELRGSSAASNGGRRSSVEEEMSQPSSAGRGSAVPLSLRGSRAKGSGTGAAGGTGGILRLLCSKGAAPAGLPHSSPPKGLSQQQQH